MNEAIRIPLPSGVVSLDKIPDRSIPFEIADNLLLDSYQRDALVPKLDDKALIRIVGERILPNIVVFRQPTTYEESLAVIYAPELLRRLKSR